MTSKQKTYLFFALIPIVALLLYLRHSRPDPSDPRVIAEKVSGLEIPDGARLIEKMVRDDGTVQICFELTADQMEDLWYAAEKKNYLKIPGRNTDQENMSVSDDGWTLVNFETVDLNLVELSVLNKATNQLCVVSGTSASIPK